MADREEKLRAAREKLDKFRKKKSHRETPSPALINKGDDSNLSSYFGSGSVPDAASDTFANISSTSSSQSGADNLFSQPLPPQPPFQQQNNHMFTFNSNHEVNSILANNIVGLSEPQPEYNNDYPSFEYPTFGAKSDTVVSSEVVSDGGVMIPETVQNFNQDSAVEIKKLEVTIEGYKKEISNFELLLQKERSEKEFALNDLKKEQSDKETVIEQLKKEKNDKEDLQHQLDSKKEEPSDTSLQSQLEEQIGKLIHQNTMLQADIITKTNTLEIIVAEKSEFESKCVYLEDQCRIMLQEKQGLTQEIDLLRQTVNDYKQHAEDGKSVDALSKEIEKRQADTIKQLDEIRAEKLELEVKLRRVCEEQTKERQIMKLMGSELEMTKVHLTQLRGANAEGGNSKEIGTLTDQLQAARTSLAAANATKDKILQERDRLAEQYRNYSKDLAGQAERLSEQLRRYQDENARLVHREGGLVTQIEQMEKQLQKYVQGGKNITEEENTALKERCMSLESESRQAKEAAIKLEQMYTERSEQVEDIMKRLAIKESKMNDLATVISELQNSNDMLRSQAGETQIQPEILAAMESDKVAASRAMQQNNKMKHEIEELQKELVNLINSKAEALDQLEDSKRRVEKLSAADQQIKSLQEAIREREGIIGGLRNQVKYLESEISQHSDKETSDKHDGGKELEEALNTIRSLNSINSELRSQLEVLSSQTRECSESRTQTATPGTPPRSPSTRTRTHSESQNEEFNGDSEPRPNSESSSSCEMDQSTSSLSTSSESFVEVCHAEEGLQTNDNDKHHDNDTSSQDGERDLKETENGVKIEVTEEPPRTPVTQSADLASDVQAVQTITSSVTASPAINLDTWKKLEERFISAMNRVAALSSDKEQLEHLVTRLQDETDTITDYIIMYQHQRQQQKLRIQEKDEQLQQLARDKSTLQSKLTDLSTLVGQLLNHQDIDTNGEIKKTEAEQISEDHNQNGDDRTPASSDHESTKQELSEQQAVDKDAKIDPTAAQDTKKDAKEIYKLLSEIQAESSQMLNNVETFQPFFFDNNNSKVITV